MKDYATHEQEKLIGIMHAHVEQELHRNPALFAVTNFRRLKRGNIRMAMLSLKGFCKAAVQRFFG
ncbi:MAG: hypothetical protein AB7F61_19370 [Desulfobulbus sp.]